MLQQLAQLTLNGLITGTILALTGVGASLVFGIQRVPNFAHGEYLTFAAYVGLLLNLAFGQNLVVATIGAMGATALLAVGIHFCLLRPLRGRGLVAMSLITVGLALILRDVVFLVAGPQVREFGIDQTAVFDLGIVRISPGQAVAIGITMVITPAVALFLFWQLERSPWGRVLKTIREDETAFTAVGKNVFAFKLQALVLGAVAGLLLAWQIGVFSPDDYQPTLTFYAYLILILGGMNRLWAIPVGAAAFSLLYSGTRFLNFFPLSLIDSGSRAFLRLLLVGLLLVLFMALRPQGMLGNRRELLLGR
jgi:ABC-type branched-subunit amino acid transport system permease subunit